MSSRSLTDGKWDALLLCLLSMDSGLKACGKGGGLPGFSLAEQKPACSLLVCLWARALAFWCVQVCLGTDPAGIPSHDGMRVLGTSDGFSRVLTTNQAGTQPRHVMKLSGFTRKSKTFASSESCPQYTFDMFEIPALLAVWF